MGFLRSFKEKMGIKQPRLRAPLTLGNAQRIAFELEAEFRAETETILASIPEGRRASEADNLLKGKAEAVLAGLECLIAFGEPEFAIEKGRAEFHLWASMARGER